MKRLLGLLLVMGLVGCGGGSEAPPAGEPVSPATPNKPQAKVDEPPVQTVDFSKLVQRDGLMYEVNSETLFTGVAVRKQRLRMGRLEQTYKDGKKEGPRTEWYGDNTEVADQIKKQMAMSAGMGKQMAGDAGADAGEISGADAGSAGAATEKNSDE